jgi:ATP-dependent NAD(P)H-hydrate dehydratase
LNATAEVIKQARASSLPLVIDGDGLFLISTQPALITGYRKAILTPNVMEFRRLCNAV